MNALAIALLLQTAASPATEAMARMAAEKQVVDQINAEVVSVLTHHAKIDGSPVLRREEADSLRRRFSEIVVQPSFSSEQFVKALRDLRAVKLAELVKTSAEAVYLTCVATQDSRARAEADWVEVQASDTWVKMSLTERIEFRTALEATLDQIPKETCVREAAPDIDGSMN